VFFYFYGVHIEKSQWSRSPKRCVFSCRQNYQNLVAKLSSKIIEIHAQINCHFQCSVVSLNLCKEYLNMATIKILVLFLLKNWTFCYIESPIRHHIQKLQNNKYDSVSLPARYFALCIQIRSADRFGCSVRPGCRGSVVASCLFSPGLEAPFDF